MKQAKAIVVGIWGALMSWLGVLAIPVLLMVLCNVIDYFTGLVASAYRDDPLSSYKGIKGIFKKISMWLLAVVGAILDQLIAYAGFHIGLVLPFNFLIASVVAVWICCNEILSILENINDIGVTLPPFLQPIVRSLKKQVEEKVDMEDGKE